MVARAGVAVSKNGDAAVFVCVLAQVKMSKVKLEVLKPWIGKRIEELLGVEDEVVVGLCINMLEEKGEICPKNLQIQLTGFLARNAKHFVAELWKMLHSASNNDSGIPTEMLEAKKQELREVPIIKTK